MNENRRNFAQIETELLKAQETYLDASARMEAALAERDKALATINACQEEFDEAMQGLRSSSIPGSRWHGRKDGNGMELVLGSDQEVVPGKPKISIISDSEMDGSQEHEAPEIHFAHLRTIVEANAHIMDERERGSKAR